MEVRLHAVRPTPSGFMPDCQWLGTVVNHGTSGHFMLGPTGRYTMVIRGNAFPLDQDAAALAHAEALGRPPLRPGRRAGPDGRLSGLTVTLSAQDVATAERLGDGNISAGIRAALRAHRDAQPSSDERSEN